MGGNLLGLTNIGLNSTNLMLNWFSDKKLNKAMKDQNIGGMVLLGSAVVISVANTLWIINQVHKSKGASKQ